MTTVKISIGVTVAPLPVRILLFPALFRPIPIVPVPFLQVLLVGAFFSFIPLAPFLCISVVTIMVIVGL